MSQKECCTCMGRSLSSRIVDHLVSLFDRRRHLLVPTGLNLTARAQRRSRVASRPSRSDLPLTVASTAADLPTTTIPRGARHQARRSRCKLVFGRPVRIATMMQSCASAAKLRGGGPILNRGSKTMCKVGVPPPRFVICSSASTRQRTAEIPSRSPREGSRHARRARPTGASPEVTSRQSAMRSLRASATIIVLRMPPRAPAVRVRYHSANTLVF